MPGVRDPPAGARNFPTSSLSAKLRKWAIIGKYEGAEIFFHHQPAGAIPAGPAQRVLSPNERNRQGFPRWQARRFFSLAFPRCPRWPSRRSTRWRGIQANLLEPEAHGVSLLVRTPRTRAGAPQNPQRLIRLGDWQQLVQATLGKTYGKEFGGSPAFGAVLLWCASKALPA